MAERRRRLTGLAVVLAVAGVLAALVVFFEKGAVETSGGVLGSLNWAWVAPMLLAESGSMAAFAASQRHLLKAGTVAPPLRAMLTIVYASNALSVTFPIAGPSMATAFSFRQLRRRGVGAATGSWVLTVSGVVSSLAFGALMTVGALVTGQPLAVLVGLSVAAATTLPVVAVLASLRYERVRRLLNGLVADLVALSRRLTHHPRWEAAEGFEQLLEAVAVLRARPGRYLWAAFHSLRNWAADCACLAFAILAVGGTVPWRGLLLAYCLAIAAGSIGITPGGLGVVEVVLSAALVTAGVPTGEAFPAVVLYRLVSLWLVVGVGWVAVALLNRRTRDRGAS